MEQAENTAIELGLEYKLSSRKTQTPECGKVAVSVAVCFKAAMSESLFLFHSNFSFFKHYENFLFIKVRVDRFDQYKTTSCHLDQNVNVHMFNN